MLCLTAARSEAGIGAWSAALSGTKYARRTRFFRYTALASRTDLHYPVSMPLLRALYISQIDRVGADDLDQACEHAFLGTQLIVQKKNPFESVYLAQILKSRVPCGFQARRRAAR